MDCKERLEKYLSDHDVPFKVLRHPPAYTMQEVAAALHVSGHQVAKVVMVTADKEFAMFVLPAPYRLNLEKARDALGAKKVKLAKEDEFAHLFPDCTTGAMPPFGNLYGLPVFVDQALEKQSSIVFRIGTHGQTMKIAYEPFGILVRPTVGEFAWRS